MSLDVVNNASDKPEAKVGGDVKISKIEVDRELCIGAESCVVVAPDAFEMDEENIAIVKEGATNVDYKTLLESAQACPVAAVLLYDEDGKQVYP